MTVKLSGIRTERELALRHPGVSMSDNIRAAEQGHSLADPDRRDPFETRHIGPTAADRDHMLATVGVASVADLMEQTVPSDIRLDHPLDLPEPLGQLGAQQALRAIAKGNREYVSLIGMGYSRHHHAAGDPAQRARESRLVHAVHPVPAGDLPGPARGAAQLPDDGRDLTGMEIANASLLDEATAAAEAMTMCAGQTRRNPAFFVVDDCHPQTIAVVETRAEPLGIEVIVGDPRRSTSSARVRAC